MDFFIINICAVVDDSACTAQSGTCKLITEECRGGSYRHGFCQGPSARRCCIPWPDSNYKNLVILLVYYLNL